MKTELAAPNSKQPDYSNAIIYIFLVFGVVLIIGGIYLWITNTIAEGENRGGVISTNPTGIASLKGEWIIAVGVFILLFPTYALLKRALRKRQKLPVSKRL